MHKPKAPRTYFEELQTFTRVVTVQKSGGKGKRKRTKTYQQVYYKWVRLPFGTSNYNKDLQQWEYAA